MKSNKKKLLQQGFAEKSNFGSIYRTKGSKYLYISFYYHNQRLRLPTNHVDTPEDRAELINFMNGIGRSMKLRTFQFAKTFYWLDDETKRKFTALEGGNFSPEPEHVLFGDFVCDWMEKKIPTFPSVTKQRDYRQVLTSRILPYFGEMPFAKVTATEVHSFIDNLIRCDRTKAKKKSGHLCAALSVKRIKNIIGPMSKIWIDACNHYNWKLRNPFTGVAAKFTEISDRLIEKREQEAVLRLINGEDQETNSREVFLLEEWEELLKNVDPHYHVVMNLLLLGLIGSELEGLMKIHIKGNTIQIRCSVVRDKGKIFLKFKPKNWFRKRDIPITSRMRQLLDHAAANSDSTKTIGFDNNISIPANQFVLTMKDGSQFNYDSFRKTVWDKAIKKAGLPQKVPYSLRHTLVQWALLIGVAKTRLVDLMGHSTKKMIDEVYGEYRQGLVDERGKILDYLGEDFLSLEEMKAFFPERYNRLMSVA